ncbi:MAG: hypothetical protein ACRDOH_18995 [Streptosporangiaceae bacterium]
MSTWAAEYPAAAGRENPAVRTDEDPDEPAIGFADCASALPVG